MFGNAKLEGVMETIHNSNWFKTGMEGLSKKVQYQSDVINSSQVQLLNTTLEDIFPSNNGAEALDKVIADGTVIEPNYHLLYHPSHLPESKLGKDGYDPGFAPPNPYIDRVWAKGRLEFNTSNSIKIGQKIDLVTKTHKINQTTSASKGPMICVELLKEYSNSEGNCLNEYRTLCYFLNRKDVEEFSCFRNETDSSSNDNNNRENDNINKTMKSREKPYDMKVDINPNSLLLFRYSALTFNAHKIHYDFKYANEVEGYRDVLVHGPLTTTLTLKLVTKYLTETQKTWHTLKSLDYKLIQPLFNNEEFSIYLKKTGEGSLEVWINNNRGELAFRGNAKF